MKNLRFKYTMKTVFIEQIRNHSFTLKCIPDSFQGQNVQQLSFEVLPESELCFGKDSFGNQIIYGRVDAPHDLFATYVHGCVSVTGEAVAELPDMQSLFLYETKYTRQGDNIRRFYDSVADELRKIPEEYAKAIFLMNEVHNRMTYQQAVTGISTTAEEAFTLGKGVCQDYTHILLSLCRMAGIPARYVVGMMLGEGASHAWVEIYILGYWYGLDPTNEKCVDDTYIKISHGRDYQDCLVERGIFLGNGNQQKIVGVKVEEII